MRVVCIFFFCRTAASFNKAFKSKSNFEKVFFSENGEILQPR